MDLQKQVEIKRHCMRRSEHLRHRVVELPAISQEGCEHPEPRQTASVCSDAHEQILDGSLRQLHAAPLTKTVSHDGLRQRNWRQTQAGGLHVVQQLETVHLRDAQLAPPRFMIEVAVLHKELGINWPVISPAIGLTQVARSHVHPHCSRYGHLLGEEPLEQKLDAARDECPSHFVEALILLVGQHCGRGLLRQTHHTMLHA
mmetsp:Transcript_24563/g.33676  ORF Transcript_24563/g.33676 Transcript_24563/m.33676 type:complete len:201 (+) Transcript_24563:881-1483(+)